METLLNPPARQDAFTEWLRDTAGYEGAQRLPDGSYAVLIRLITTLAIALKVDHAGWGRRYCYNDVTTCLAEWQALTSGDDQPAGWIATRPE